MVALKNRFKAIDSTFFFIKAQIKLSGPKKIVCIPKALVRTPIFRLQNNLSKFTTQELKLKKKM